MMKYQSFIVQEVIRETHNTFTLRLSGHMEVQPGQFIMLTDFANGEKPFSFSKVSDNSCEITIKAVGEFTRAISKAKIGDTLYIRGPYGNYFSLPEKDARIILIGGGCGTAPIRLWLHHLLQAGFTNITFINGARSADELLYRDEFARLPITVYDATDDGSTGFHGYTPDLTVNILGEQQFDVLYTAGPELMMKSLHEKLKSFAIPSWYLLERYMKCGIGICGQCTLDPLGIRLCVEGPVVPGTVLNSISEFGNYTRDAYGGRKTFAGIGCT